MMIQQLLLTILTTFLCPLFLFAQTTEKQQWHYDFNEPLGPEWTYIQQPDTTKYQVVDGWLELATSNSSLTDNDRPTFVGHHQQTETFELETRLRLPDSLPGDEAGLTVYGAHDAHAEAFLQNLRGELFVKVRYTLKNLRQVVKEVRFGNAREVWLRVRCDGRYYLYYYSTDGTQFHYLERIDASLLTNVGGHGTDYTGILLGLYSWGGGAQFAAGRTWSCFDYLTYTER